MTNCACGQQPGRHHAWTCPKSAVFKSRATVRCNVCIQPLKKCDCIPCPTCGEKMDALDDYGFCSEDCKYWRVPERLPTRDY